MSVKPLPKRSPGLQPLDYTFHNLLKRKMLAQTKGWPADKTETRPEYMARLLATYNSLTKEEVDKGCGDMVRRLKVVHEAQGGHTHID